MQYPESQDSVKLSLQCASSFSAIPHLFESPDSAVNPKRFLSQKILETQNRRTSLLYRYHHSIHCAELLCVAVVPVKEIVRFIKVVEQDNHLHNSAVAVVLND